MKNPIQDQIWLTPGTAHRLPARQNPGKFQQELMSLAFAPLYIRADSVLSAAVEDFHISVKVSHGSSGKRH